MTRSVYGGMERKFSIERKMCPSPSLRFHVVSPSCVRGMTVDLTRSCLRPLASPRSAPPVLCNVLSRPPVPSVRPAYSLPRRVTRGGGQRGAEEGSILGNQGEPALSHSVCALSTRNPH